MSNELTHFPLTDRYFVLIKSLIQFFKKEILKALGLGIIIAAMSPIMAFISGYIFQHVHEVNIGRHQIIFIFFFALIISCSLFSYWHDHYLKSINSKILFVIFPNLVQKFLYLPFATIKKYSTGEWAERLLDYEVTISTIGSLSLSMLLNGLTLLFLIIEMLYCNMIMTSIYLGICITLTLIKLLLFPRQLTALSQQLTAQGKLSSFLQEIFLQIHKIRSAHIENEVYEKWLQGLIAIKLQAAQFTKLNIIINTLDTIMPFLQIVIFYWVIYFSSLSVVVFLQLIIAAGLFAQIFEKFSADILLLIHHLPGLKRIKPILDSENEFNQNKKSDFLFSGAIKFSEVYFQSNENKKMILENISLEINPGEYVAFIGASGSGKSTLLKLMLGLEFATQGIILIGNDNIHDLNYPLMRQQFGVVLQTSNLLPGTIFSNLSAHCHLTLEDAWELTRLVALDQDIKNMPMQMFTHVSDNAGESLSGGQKQKLLIARALATRPTILLLDEATSALDNRSQDLIYQHLKTLKITRVVVAHRLNTIRGADRIYRLDRGKIALQKT